MAGKDGSKTFLLGVGAQKSGTTWVHHWLEATPGVALGPFKEYHVWDARTLPACRQFRHRLFGRNPKNRLLARMQRVPALYFRHFAGLLDRPGVHLTADITPSYSGLSPDTLRLIRDGFARRGIAVKVLFLMRDPVARSYSAARMLSEKESRLSGPVTPEDWLARNLATEAMRLRSDYPATVAALHRVFPPDAVHLEVYEHLFTPAGLRRLAGFLDLPLDAALAGRRVNEGRPAPLPEALARRAARHFAPVYHWADQTLPEARRHWQGFALLNRPE